MTRFKRTPTAAALVILTAILSACSPIQVDYLAVPADPNDTFKCDRFLKEEFVLQKNARTASHMQHLIKRIQDDRSKDCDRKHWSPVIDDTTANEACWRGTPPTLGQTKRFPLHYFNVPPSMYTGNHYFATVRLDTHRDEHNNILIYWSTNPDHIPANEAVCWLYLAEPSFWDERWER